VAENSGIQWTTHTFNPWRGCTKVSAGCANCYAETMSGRNHKVLGQWGPNGTRVVAAEAQWKEPVKWNREAEFAAELFRAAGGDASKPGSVEYKGRTLVYAGRPRVFCASLADVFEEWRGPMVNAQGQMLYTFGRGSLPWTSSPGSPPPGQRPLTMGDVRLRLFDVIRQTPHLDWLLLTKRPENVTRWIADAMNIAWGVPQKGTPLAQWVEDWLTHLAVPQNVWLGTSVENQAAADERIPHLFKVPAAVRFLSCEPLLGPVNLKLDSVLFGNRGGRGNINGANVTFAGIDWVIVGGESGPGARPMNVEWARSLVQQCKAAGVACFVKQMGGNFIEDARPSFAVTRRIPLADAKGGDPDEWPADLRVREFPQVPA